MAVRFSTGVLLRCIQLLPTSVGVDKNKASKLAGAWKPEIILSNVTEYVEKYDR